MAKTLLILRHGKSDHGLQYGSDFERPLAERGERAAKRVAKLLEDLDLQLELIVSSPALRAKTTAEIIAALLGDTELELQERIYAADTDDLLWVIHGLAADVNCAMLVGHNPTFEELVDELTGRSDTIMKTCSLAVLDFPGDDWTAVQARGCKLRELYHPRELDT